jgi:hypothetical protein
MKNIAHPAGQRAPRPADVIRLLAGSPGPDLILVMGSDAARFALAVKRHVHPAVRIVKLGRPMFRAAGIDLWITARQYPRLPWLRQIAVDLPFHLVSPEVLRAKATSAGADLKALPRPRVAVLIGGTTGSFQWSGAIARQLAAEVNADIAAAGGSILLTTSRRTGASAESAIASAITVPGKVHFWAEYDPDNPYLTYLALADAIIVTEDSVSMIAEACAAGKPLAIWRLPQRRHPARRLLQLDRLARWLGFGRARQLEALLSDGRLTWFSPARQFARLPATDEAEGCMEQDKLRAISAIRALMADRDGGEIGS